MNLVFENVNDPVLRCDQESFSKMHQTYYEKVIVPRHLMIPFSNFQSCQNHLGCRNLRRHSHLQTWWTHIFFFFLDLHFFSFYRACLALRYCLSAPSCACQEFFYLLSPSTCVLQNAWPGNRVVKCADAYIVRRKCRIQWVIVTLTSSAVKGLMATNQDQQDRRSQASYIVWDRLGCRNLQRHSQLPTWMNPHLFFLLHPYRSCSPATFSSTSSTWRRSRCHKTSRGSGNTGWRGTRRRAWGRPGGRCGPQGQRQGQARDTQSKSCSRGVAGIGRSQKKKAHVVRT